jgi:predicted DNA-binding transcriptional regulator AlpA
MQLQDDLLDCATTRKFFGGSRPIDAATLSRGIKRGLYPKPVRVSANSSRWLRSECEAALAAIVARRDDPIAQQADALRIEKRRTPQAAA